MDTTYDLPSRLIETIEASASQGTDYAAIMKRIDEMAKTENQDIGGILASLEDVAKCEIEKYQALQKQGEQVTQNIYITNIINSPNAKVVINPPAEKKIKRLNFRRIHDDRLSLADRIVFSLLWQWAHWNSKKKSAYVPSNKRLREHTGFRLPCVKKSVQNLTQLGYLDDKRRPLLEVQKETENSRTIKKTTLKNGIPYSGYTKVEFVTGGNLKGQIASGVVADLKKKQWRKPSWVKKILGISRSSAYTLLLKASGRG